MTAALAELTAANQHRLAAGIELIEACHAMGEQLDPQTAIDVLAQVNAEIQQEAERSFRHLPNTARPVASPEDLRDACALIAAARIMWDAGECIRMRTNPGRRLRLVMKAREMILTDLLAPILQTIEPGERRQILDNATTWQYTLWSPEHMQMTADILDSVMSGRPPKREIKEAAAYLRTRLIPTPDLDRIKQQLKEEQAQ